MFAVSFGLVAWGYCAAVPSPPPGREDRPHLDVAAVGRAVLAVYP